MKAEPKIIDITLLDKEPFEGGAHDKKIDVHCNVKKKKASGRERSFCFYMANLRTERVKIAPHGVNSMKW